MKVKKTVLTYVNLFFTLSYEDVDKIKEILTMFEEICEEVEKVSSTLKENDDLSINLCTDTMMRIGQKELDETTDILRCVYDSLKK